MPLLRPHSLSPSLESVRCLTVYKNFAAARGISHIGLGVAALNTSQVLRQSGIWHDVSAIRSSQDLEAQILATDGQAIQRGETRLSHVVVSAPWIPTLELAGLVSRHPQINFAVVSHSNVAFLHADPNGLRLLREGIGLQTSWHNFRLAGNSQKFVDWMLRAYGASIAYLPNLYNLAHAENRTQRTRPPYHGGGPLRIGSFGAVRVLKNHVTAAAAALELARRFGVDTEFWMSHGRSEGAGTVLASIEQMTRGIKGFTLKSNTWETWPDFTTSLRHMNLLLQPSFTESFNMVTADGVSAGVPSVVSDAIEWVPAHWQAKADDALDIANKAAALLHDPTAAAEGWRSLQAHNAQGIRAWHKHLIPSLARL